MNRRPINIIRRAVTRETLYDFYNFRFDWNIEITPFHNRNGNVFDRLTDTKGSIDEIQLENVWQIS